MSHFLSPNPVTTVCWENMWRVTAYCVMMRGPSEGGWETDSAQWVVKKRNWGERKEKRWGEEKGRACSHCSTGAWNRALRSASPIIHSLDKELCLSQDTRGWEMTKLKNKLRDRSHQGKERFCEMAFAATTPRSPFKRYFVSTIKKIWHHSGQLKIIISYFRFHFGHSREMSTTRQYFCGHFTQLHLTCVEDRAICSHPTGRWRALRWLTSLSTLTPAAIGLGELGKSIRTIKTNMNEFTQGYQQRAH